MRFAAAASFLALSAGAAHALPPVWVVRDHEATLVMFGSLNVLPQNTDWRPAELQEALAHADEVWFEAPMDAAGLSEASWAALAHAFLPEGQRLQTLLTPVGRVRLVKTAKLLGLPLAQIDKLQPWYAELMIQGMLFRRMGIKGSVGIGEKLWSELPATVRRVTLETPEQQVRIFVEAPLADQVASLEKVLKDVPNAGKNYDQLLKAWLGGDIRALDLKAVEPLKKTSPTLYDRLVAQRNAGWVMALKARMRSPGETVVVVSMGNMLGSDGLPARLRAQGFKVEGPG